MVLNGMLDTRPQGLRISTCLFGTAVVNPNGGGTLRGALLKPGSAP